MLHSPQRELSDGKFIPAVEVPQRAESVLEQVELQKLGSIEEPSDFGLNPILRIHSENYVSFLENFWSNWTSAGREGEAFPFVWPVRGFNIETVPSHIDGQLGYYSFDAGTPIGKHTYRAALASAYSALSGAAEIASGEFSSFALCRPPGHHAAHNYFGGYCFLNNAAVAAQFLLDNGAKRITILDVDYHHGNGTQTIFFDRRDVLFISIHADTMEEFPYFLGSKEETGIEEGSGYNINYPLPKGTNWKSWSESLADSLRCVLEFKPDAMVISLGLDVFKNDPISHFCLVEDDFCQMGERLRDFNLPTLFVMEGGYAVTELGTNCLNVLKAFEG